VGWEGALERADQRKYIFGRVTLKPGKGKDHVEIARAYAAGCRGEDGCIFFEMNQSVDDPDVFVIAECFRDAAAHEAHLKRPLFLEAWKDLERNAVSATFENVVARSVTAQSVTFGKA
jgi:quinol monooxygenase YgiN